MSLLIFASLVALVFCASFAALYFSKSNISLTSAAALPEPRAGRYRPMLRLLSEEDLIAVRHDKKLMRSLRAERIAIFRGYVRCLTLDYGRVLAGLRRAAVESATDRPDLARTILRNRILFAGLIFRIDVFLFLYRLGARRTDMSRLLERFDSLRAQAVRTTPTPALLAA